MQVWCPQCRRVLDFSGDRPLFCAYCGQPLGSVGSEGSDPKLLATAEYESGSASPLPDSGGGETVPGSGDRNLPRGRGRGLPEPAPERVAGYSIIRLLGRGGMGSVYEAEDDEFGRRVALKLIAADHVSSAEAVERFRQEGRLASTLSHPRCVFVLAADEFNGRPYIVMELMPGETLQALVEERGPLPLAEAVGKILDVIEGLTEAHIQGVIHRDVKPSNCFVGEDGRVKVGDFGLSKSLDSDAGLTRTGSFVGTPLYASPEQIKRDVVDARTDVYSVAATLYFLLTGKPPFQADDAAAALAKIVSEPPTPMRQFRPELPPALEAAVFRGLDRDRDRRWQSLERFREALLPFVAAGLRLSDMALRTTAYVADASLLLTIEWILFTTVIATSQGGPRETFWWLGRHAPILLVTQRLFLLVYFTVTEGIWGASLGKRFTRLRVSAVVGSGPPGLWRAGLRALAFYVVTTLPADLLSISLFGLLPGRSAVVYEPLSVALRALGLLAMASTMRAGNGFRGLHEWWSKTSVGRLAGSSRRRVPRGRKLPNRPDLAREMATGQVGVLKAFGTFRVRGAVRWDGDQRVLLGEDSALERPVWIVLRSKGSPAPSQTRRDLGRPSRPRWLSGGEQAEGRWDAYAAPSGCPLADLAGPTGLPWADARPILHDLADELAKACADGTLPDALSTEQVWIQPNGTVQLVDPLARLLANLPPIPAQERALALLRIIAALTLEGGRRRGSGPPKSIRAVVPEHASRMLDRLIGRPRAADEAYNSLGPLVADLEADREKPTEIGFARRAVHLAPASVMILPVLGVMSLLAYPGESARPQALVGLTSLPSHFGLPSHPATLLLALPLLVILWSTLTRGGLLYGITGMALVRADGRPAERWRCGWRALIVWTPFAALLTAACWTRMGSHPSASWSLWILALTLLATYPVLALAFPSRSIHDRLAGTWLVPK